MKADAAWTRAVLVEHVRKDIWRYLTAVARPEAESLMVEAAAILGLPLGDLRALATVHFVLSPEVQALLEGMQRLSRRLATTTIREEQTSGEAVRGPIVWGPTLSAQAAAGVRQTYVTAPARRAYDTPENQVLVAALAAVVKVGAQTGWLRLAEKHLADEVRTRVDLAQHWLQARALSSVPIGWPPPRTLARVSGGRARRRYRPAVNALVAHRDMVRRLEPSTIRRAIEKDALVATRDDTLFELMCAFVIERDLKSLGWKTRFPGLVRSGRFLLASKAHRSLTLYYQHVPPSLGGDPIYRQVLEAHGVRVGVLRPDLVLRLSDGPTDRWVLGEIKGGQYERDGYARDALLDLLAYRRNYEKALAWSAPPYGLGIVWGEELQPKINDNVVLCTPDTIRDALVLLLASN